MNVRRLLFVQHPAERMYDLIEGAEYYPDFLPWCSSVTVHERTERFVAATLGVDWHGVRLEFTTRNRKQRPEWLELALVRGPFRHFRGAWELKPLGSAGCKIEFLLDYEFASDLLARAAGPLFEHITDTLVDAFVKRADVLGKAIPPLPPVDPGWPGIRGG